MVKSSILTGGIIVNCFLLSACSDSDDDGSGNTGGTAGSAGSAGSGGASGGGGMPAAPACPDIPSLATGDSSFTISSAEFGNCTPIPAAHTCDQKPFPQGSSPSLSWTAGPAGTQSYAVAFKDIAILARTDQSDPAYNRGYHYVIWDIPASVTSLPAAMMGGHLSTEVPGARQWSNFNDYGYFGPCPNFDPAMPTSANDSYSFVVYALPAATATVPAPQMGISTVRLMDDSFKVVALATAEHRGTSGAAASELPEGVLPPMTNPPCPSSGEQPAGCLAGP